MPYDRRHITRAQTARLLLTITLAANFKAASSQHLVLYTSPRENHSAVVDNESNMVYSGHSAFGLFVCSESKTPTEMQLPCRRDIDVWTRMSEAVFMVSWINDQHEFQPLPNEMDIKFRTYNAKLQEEPVQVLRRLIGRDDGATFHLEVKVSGLSKEDVRLEATFRNQILSVLIRKRRVHPEIWITTFLNGNCTNKLMTARATLESSVSKTMPVSKRGKCTCRNGDGETLQEQSFTTADLLSCFRSCRWAERSTKGFVTAVQVEGAEKIRRLMVNGRAIVRVKFDAKTPRDIRFRLDPQTVSDPAGNLNREATNAVIYHRPTIGVATIERGMRLTQRRMMTSKQLTAGAALGKAATVLVGGAMASSSATGGATGAQGQSVPLFLIGILQKLFLSGNVAVNDMPDMYTDFTAQLTWVMFDFPSPFERFVRADTSADDVDELEENRSYWSTRTGAYLYMARVFFWVPLFFFCLLFLHLVVLFLCFWRKTPIPYIFSFPRIEIMFCYWGMPAVATACAGLLRGGKVDALIAVWLLVLFPGSMIAWNLTTLWCFFYSKPIKKHRVNFIVESTRVREKAVIKLRKEWKRMQSMRRHVGIDPPIFFANPGFDHQPLQIPPLSLPRQRSLYRDEPPLLKEDFHQAPVYVRDGTSVELMEVVERRFDEEKAVTNNENLHRLSTGYPMTTSTLSSATGSSSFNTSDGGGSQTRRSDRRHDFSALIRWPSLELLNPDDTWRRFRSPNTITAQESSSSSGKHWYSSIDEVNRSSNLSDPETRYGSVSFRDIGDSMDDTVEVEAAGSGGKSHGVKFSGAERFMFETSNNPIAFLALGQTDVGENRVSSTAAFSSNDAEWEESNLADFAKPAQDAICQLYPQRQRSLDRSFQLRGECVVEDKSVKQRIIDWSAYEIECTAVPKPAWRSILADPSELFNSIHDKLVTESPFPTPRTKTRLTRRLVSLSRIPEDTSDQNKKSSSFFSHSYSNFSSTRATTKSNHHHQIDSETRDSCLPDSQLGISVIRPEYFAETAARLRHINNECLMDMGLDHLIPQETTLSDDEAAEYEELEMASEATVQGKKPATAWVICIDLCDLAFGSLIMGRHQPRGYWRPTPTAREFVFQYGYLFEDFHGPPALLREPTYDIIGGRMDRGKVFPLKLRPLFYFPGYQLFGGRVQIPGVTLYKHNFQLMARFLQMLKVLLLGVSVAGVGTGLDSFIQITVLLSACLFLLIVLRLSRPYRSRTEMTISLSEEAADSIFLTLAILLLHGPRTNEDFKRRIGQGMITAECISLLAIVSYQLIKSWKGVANARKRRSEKRRSQMAFIFRQYLSRNAYFMKRKYFDRWMVHALGRGLHSRIPNRHEMLRRDFIKIQRRKILDVFVWFGDECFMIWKDLLRKLSAAGIKFGAVTSPTAASLDY